MLRVPLRSTDQRVKSPTLTVLSIAHVVLRVVYIFVYIGNYNAKIAALRTVVYVLSMLCILGLFIASAIAP